MRSLVVLRASNYAQVVPRRLIVLAAVLTVCSLGVGSAVALADAKPAEGPFAEFRACMKAHGAPALSHRRLTDDERAALRQAFAACRGLLPKPTGNERGNRAKHKFARPSAAQFAAFKACMAGKGFSSSKPDLRDPAVRTALLAALKECLPLLKPKPASTG